MDIEEIEKLIEILNKSEITDLELEKNGNKIKLSKKAVTETVYVASPQPSAVTNISVPSSFGGGASRENIREDKKAPVNEDVEAYVKVSSPIVGTFYRKPGPDADPFVVEGKKVKKGDTLCIVEAMKLMNPIESPCNGTVHKVCLTDGQVVEFGEVLFLLKPE